MLSKEQGDLCFTMDPMVLQHQMVWLYFLYQILLLARYFSIRILSFCSWYIILKWINPTLVLHSYTKNSPLMSQNCSYSFCPSMTKQPNWQWKPCTVSNWQLSQNNQHVSYSVLSWKGRMDTDSFGSKGTIFQVIQISILLWEWM